MKHAMAQWLVWLSRDTAGLHRTGTGTHASTDEVLVTHNAVSMQPIAGNGLWPRAKKFVVDDQQSKLASPGNQASPGDI
jgi:hypothetical protein